MQSLLTYIVILIISFEIIGCVASPRFTSDKFVKSSSEDEGFSEEGVASYYADEFNGRQTSNGEIYDMNELTAAHRTLPFNTLVKVTNVQNGKSVVVRINDRGPFKGERIIDLSLAAAKTLGMIGPGTVNVKLEIIELGDTSNKNNP
ncbi:MAG: septal ring lytic transglycosylase RlpA family protein [Ignavibacteriales bacterium]|nr:septal ring lytic transglycosylase RlpA family protein [Ignavibacteriales bacterium]